MNLGVCGEKLVCIAFLLQSLNARAPLNMCCMVVTLLVTQRLRSWLNAEAL